MNFQNKKIGIWGLGVVGQAAIRFFHSLGITTTVLDQKEPSLELLAFLAAHGAQFVSNDKLSAFLADHDLIVASPGIDLRPYKKHEHKWASELDIFRAYWHKPIIAITGSVGKTTVTHLLSTLLAATGKKVATGGNIGVGMLDLLEQQATCDYAVLEVSSFQLEMTRTFAADLALWTNFHANHLDRHGSLESYFSAKMHLINQQHEGQKAILPLELKKKFQIQRPSNWFSNGMPSPEDSATLAENDSLYYLHENNILYMHQRATRTICALEQLPDITFAANWLLIAAALDTLGIHIIDAVEQAQLDLPEHRLEFVTSIQGAPFYNDSKSTIPAATLAALEKFKDKSVVLFVGGVSKGIDRTDFIKQLAGKVKSIYCFGKEAEQLFDIAQSNAINAYHFANLDDAFEMCISLLEPEDTILFSPAGASFDLFANYQERGMYFKKLVETYR